MVFDVHEDAYDSFMGRYSQRLAPLFADFAGVSGGMTALDVGAGTGLLAAELVRRVGAESVAVAEPSSRFVEAVRQRLPGVDAHEATAEELPWPDESFDAALAQLVIAFVPDAPAAALELRRVVRPGGVVALTMWEQGQIEPIAVLRRLQQKVVPDVPDPEPQRYRTAEELVSLLAGAGLADARTTSLEVEADYRDVDDFWRSASGAVGPAGKWLAELDEERRAAARAALDDVLGNPSGDFTLRGRAVAVRATRV